MREWQELLPSAEDIGLWVNLAPGEFTNERLVEDLAFALSRARFDPRKLTVEITEGSVMRDEHNGLKAMHRLRDLGVALSIDDFGTGYSSLSRLAQFPIQLLKIPKTFVDPLAGADADTSFIDAILRLADSLGILTVAEGIEHPAQARRLREVGCRARPGLRLQRAAHRRRRRSSLLRERNHIADEPRHPGRTCGPSPAPESRPTERRRSRTDLAVGYTTVRVLKTRWATRPGRSAAEASSRWSCCRARLRRLAAASLGRGRRGS